MNGDLVINYVEMLGPRTDAIVEAWGRIQVLAHAGVVTAAVGYAGQQWRFALARLYEGWGVLEMAAGENPPGEGSLFVSAAVMSLFALHRDEARTFGVRVATDDLPGFKAQDLAREIVSLLVFWRRLDPEAHTSRFYLVLRDVGRAILGSGDWDAAVRFAERPEEAYPNESWAVSDWGTELPNPLIG